MKLTLFLNHRCNLRCSYCYTGEKFNRAMSIDVAGRAIDFGLKETTTGYLLIAFFGGEPMLEIDAIEKIVEMAKKKAKIANKKLFWWLTSNGTLLDTRRLQLLKKERFQIQISLDGNRKAQDATRPRANGESSFDDVNNNLKKLLAEGFRVRVVSVLDPNNMHYMADSFEHYLNLGCKEVLFSPNYTANWDEENCRRFEVALSRLGDRYISAMRDGRDIRLDPLNGKIATHLKDGYSASTRCAFGQQELAVSTTGYIYPCDRLVGEDNNDAIRIGHIDTGIDRERRDAMIADKNKSDPECEDCPLANRCMRWCGCANFETTGNIAKVSPTTCWFEQCFIHEADRIASTLYKESCPTFMRRFYVQRRPTGAGTFVPAENPTSQPQKAQPVA